MEIGAQLYTVRDFCKTLDDFDETLKRIADIGFRNVQVSGTCDYEAQWLKERLEKYGLNCVLTHINAEKLRDKTEEVITAHDAFKCKYVGIGGYNFGDTPCASDIKKFINEYKETVVKLKESGKYFMYHNHDREFRKVDGKLIFDSLAEGFSKDEMGFTLDTFWVQAGGGDAADWLEKLNGRVPCIHLKDFAFGTKMAVLGEGNINFERIFAKAERAGTKYMLVEQDDCYGENPFDCLKRSYDYLKARGFE